MKSVYSIIKRSCVDNRTVITNGTAHFHKVSQEMKSLPRIISDANSLDKFQYFSMKIKDLMDKEQLEYFDNVIRKVENIDHPVAALMRYRTFSYKVEKKKR